MFSPHKHSYLQLVCAVDPRVINKAVDLAMRKEHFDPHTESPAAQRLQSMQPSLYAPHVDITRARLGYGRVGLRLLTRDLHSPDHLVQLQAVHTLLDQVQISENAIFLINLQVVYRLINLMLHQDPVIREKVCFILTHLSQYYQGRKKIMSRPKILEILMWLAMRDRKELRYAAATTLRALTKDRCCVEEMLKCKDIVENLLKMVKYEHTSIVCMHLKTLESLIEWDQICPLKANAFQIMLALIRVGDRSIVQGALNCMTQLCKHSVGRELADSYDLTYFLLPYIASKNIVVTISALGLMAYTTQTVRSKWRAKEYCVKLTELLANFCLTTSPMLQLRSMQVLINLCDSPDIRKHVKAHWENELKGISIRTAEDWDGTSETQDVGLNTSHHYRSVFIDGAETIRNDIGDENSINVHSYVKRLHQMKKQLIAAINWKPYRN